MTDFPERIVYVEDEPDIRRIVREALERAHPGIVLVTCASGQELLSRFRELQPSLILLDLKMPGLSGPDVLEKLQKIPEGAGVPVIFVTGKTKVEMMENYESLGVIGVIHKPFQLAEFPAQIERLWKDFQNSRAGESARPADAVANEIM